jgi:hypothetical protein
MKTKHSFMLVTFLVTAFTTIAQSVWKLAGNNNVNSNTNFLGTLQKKDLVFRTDDIERMRIKSDGNVGIGLNKPVQKLDVKGNINIAADSGLYIGNDRVFYTTRGRNVACGYIALKLDPASTNNTACGSFTLPFLTSGDFNTAIGSGALNSLRKGQFNTAVGGAALILSSEGNENTALGYFATTTGIISNSTAIGYQATTTASDEVRVGNYEVTSIGGFADWTNISDKRVKKNIRENVPGLAFINKLKPVTYNLDLNAADRIMRPDAAASLDGKPIQPTQQDVAARTIKEQVIYTGFVAQDVEQAAKELDYDFSGVDAAKNEKDLYGLRYAEFVVPLVKAVQELSSKNDVLEKENNQLEKRIEKLETLLNVQSADILPQTKQADQKEASVAK